MVIRYVPSGNSDELSCAALVDVASAATGAVVVGAWMTKAWVLIAGGALPRVTNDVDVAAQPEVRTDGFGGALIDRGYLRDERGYPFRYSRQTDQGVRLVDVLADENAQHAEPAFPVFGLDEATRSLVDVTIEIAGLGSAPVRLPTLDGAFLLRSLALADGAAGLKFQDYAGDAAAIGQLLLAEATALAAWRARTGACIARARDIALPLFAASSSPGPLAVAQRARGDRDLAARQASATFNELFGRGSP